MACDEVVVVGVGSPTGRAAVGRGVATQGLAEAELPRVHQAERGDPPRRRQHQRVRLGKQARRHQRPHLQGIPIYFT